MTNEPNLKDIERKAYTTYHQDGLIDIFASIYIIGFAVGILLDFLWDYSFGLFIPGILVIFVLPLWIAAKRKITIPRIGFVKFGTRSSSNVPILLTGVMGLGVAFLLVFLLFGRESWLGSFIIEYGMVLVGIGGLAVSALFGYAMGLKRFYLYGLLALTLFMVSYLFEVFFAYILLALGSAVMVAGFTLLIRFVRKYPLKR